MKLPRPKFMRFLAILAEAFLLSSGLFAQAEFAGRYIGSLNTSVNAGGFALESGVGVYIADVDSSGGIVFNGVLTGTVDAGGNVAFTGGTQLTLLGITTATISNGTLSSEYGALVGNGTTRYRINPSTGFTAAEVGVLAVETAMAGATAISWPTTPSTMPVTCSRMTPDAGSTSLPSAVQSPPYLVR